MKGVQNGKVILKDGILTGHTLLYTDVITAIVPDDQVPEDIQILDAQGGYVAPGLIDLHIHGYLRADTCDCDAQGIYTMAKGIAANGVTGFLPTTMTVDMQVIRKALEVCRQLQEESRRWDGAAILGCHAEGPFINPSKKGAQAESNILPPDADFILKNADIIYLCA